MDPRDDGMALVPCGEDATDTTSKVQLRTNVYHGENPPHDEDVPMSNTSPGNQAKTDGERSESSSCAHTAEAGGSGATIGQVDSLHEVCISVLS